MKEFLRRQRLGNLKLTRTWALILLVMAFALWSCVAVLPWAGDAPDLDAMVNLRESFVFYRSGVGGLLENRGGSTHPPLIYIFNSLGFALFGQRPLSLALMGLLLLVWLGLVLFNIFSESASPCMSALAAFVLSMNPLLVSCFRFMMSEGLIVLTTASCLLFYLRRKWVLLAIALCAFGLVKQTALVFVGAFGLAVLFSERTSWRRRIGTASGICLPVAFVAAGWMSFLAFKGGGAWNNEIMGNSSGGNPFTVALHALLGGFTSVYFRQNLANAFLVNFNWVSLLGGAFAVQMWLRHREQRARLFPVAALCVLVYALFVFPFPTWTIPRYGLPALFPLLVLGALALLRCDTRWGASALLGLGALSVVAQFLSFDPLTRAVYGTFEQRGQEVYDTHYSWRGPDRVMYNLQLALMSRVQNARLQKVFDSGASVMVGDCHDLKFGEKAWSVSAYPEQFSRFSNISYVACVLPQELVIPERAALVRNAKVALIPPLKSLEDPNLLPSSVVVIE
jgi:4-amino-4-deoxy-L-arabinose transferase-like glycosyltransferase